MLYPMSRQSLSRMATGKNGQNWLPYHLPVVITNAQGGIHACKTTRKLRPPPYLGVGQRAGTHLAHQDVEEGARLLGQGRLKSPHYRVEGSGLNTGVCGLALEPLVHLQANLCMVCCVVVCVCVAWWCVVCVCPCVSVCVCCVRVCVCV